MPQVSKGELRVFKQRTAKLEKAVPTLDLRRKQLTRELLVWEERLAELKKKRHELAERMKENPHPEIDRMVTVKGVRMADVNIAGVMLKELESVEFAIAPYSLIMTPPSFDQFVSLKSRFLEAEESVKAMEESLARLLDELAVTTQRINLFEKRLIPDYEESIRYIRGRLEDNERSSVIVAKIAQAALLGKQDTFESA